MQVKNFSVYKDVSVQVKVSKDRFYDYKQLATLSADTTIRVALTPYAGLSAEFVNGEPVATVAVSSGELPDYSTFSGTSGILRTFGQKFLSESGVEYQGLLASGLTDTGAAVSYNLFYKDGGIMLDTAESLDGWLWVGGLNVPAHDVTPMYSLNYTESGAITYDLPYVSGFTENKYLVSKQTMPKGTYFAPTLRFITRVAGVTSPSSTQNILWDESTNNHGFGISSSKWRIWNGAANVGGTVTEGGSYWVMLLQNAHDGTQLYYLLDDGTYSEATLPLDVSAWTLAVSVSGTLFDINGAGLRIGTGYTTPSEYWHGKIDLCSTRVDLGQYSMEEETSWSEYWRPLIKG